MAAAALGSARARRERYVGPWLPEPLVEDLSGTEPADRVTLDESVSMALLVVLEQLSPAERTSFLLHDVFGMSFTEVATVVGRSPPAVRQLASRARQRVDGGRPRFPPTAAQQEELVSAFAAACADGNLEGLVTLLDPDRGVAGRRRREGHRGAGGRAGCGRGGALAAGVHAAPAHPGPAGHRQRRARPSPSGTAAAC